jgi:hypothetical protein
LADPLRRILHAVDVSIDIDEFDLTAERLQAAGNEIGETREPFQVTAA